jgi:4-hydroxy 2-oxovalerate aldolase
MESMELNGKSGKISLLDCTLRDGSYITKSQFGKPAIRGIIKKLQDANVDIIECGWLKDEPYKDGSAFYHVPADLEQYLIDRQDHISYVVMIDWDRYDTSNLPEYDKKSIDAIRVVFPHGRQKDGIDVGRKIRDRGYRVFFQAANTIAYSDDELKSLAADMNEFMPESLSIVDTFGAMYPEDLERISGILDSGLDDSIKLGFHSHNNQQLSFALTIHFADIMKDSGRNIIVDSSLCGMGRGAGNATTELTASYLDRKCHGNYDMNAILDAIDIYMEGFKEKYTWGYSTPYFISGLYQTHVNNVAYLLKNHRASAKDMNNIFASLSTEERRHYDYDLLERVYIENQDRKTDDENAVGFLKTEFQNRKILLIAPGKSVITDSGKIHDFIDREHPVVIGVNAVCGDYKYDYMFYTNAARYQYASEVYPERMSGQKTILLSNIKTSGSSDDIIINFNRVIKRGWEHFDNAVILALRLMNALHVSNVVLAGFDGFKTKYNESYADPSLPTLNPGGNWDALNEEISDMYRDVYEATKKEMKIEFITESIFDCGD